jgi:AAHS family 4-hydroxybenzoate transporter-like MFS transporter
MQIGDQSIEQLLQARHISQHIGLAAVSVDDPLRAMHAAMNYIAAARFVTTSPLDIGRLLDESRLSTYQVQVVALTALTIIFDGADIQLLAFAVPSMMQDWNVARPTFAPVLAASLIGMMIGGALSGLAGDRLGRKVALTGSVAVFGISTLAVVAVNDLFTLGVFRFLAGLGLGGAIPNAAALTAEYMPLRHRPLAVTVTIVCVPVGGTLAGLLAAPILPAFGWRALFLVGGVAPLLVALVLWWLLPESPRFLVRDPARWPQLTRVLRRLGHDLPAAPVFADAADHSRARATIGALLSSGLAHDTLALWSAFSFCLLAVYLAFNWVPAALTSTGLDVATGSRGLAAFNFGGIAGALIGALVTTRVGSKATLTALALSAAASAAITAAMPIGVGTSSQLVILMLAVMGALVNGTQVGLYAVATHLYPTALRATGVGTALSVGRLGGVVSTYLGAWALDLGGTKLFFAGVALAMVVAMGAVLVLRDHVTRTAVKGAL